MLGNVLTRRAALVGLAALCCRGFERLQHDALRRDAADGCLGRRRRDQCRYDAAGRLCRQSDGGLGRSSPCLASLPRFLGPAPAAPLHVRIDTLYLGGGGPGDPDRMRGVAMLGGRTINVRAVSTYWSNPTDQALPEQALQGRVQALSVPLPTG